MSRTIRKFYIAAPYSHREATRKVAREIEDQSAGGRVGWTCNARWIEGTHDGLAATICAADDVADVRDADALVLLHGESTTGGFWVELGIAIERNLPIVIVTHSEVDRRLPVFAWFEAPRGRIDVVEVDRPNVAQIAAVAYARLWALYATDEDR